MATASVLKMHGSVIDIRVASDVILASFALEYYTTTPAMMMNCVYRLQCDQMLN